jgi:hypothetical protein
VLSGLNKSCWLYFVLPWLALFCIMAGLLLSHHELLCYWFTNALHEPHVTGLIHSVFCCIHSVFTIFWIIHKFLVCTLVYFFVYTQISLYKNRVWCRFRTRITICIQDTITFWFIRMECVADSGHMFVLYVSYFLVETQVSVWILLAQHHRYHHFLKNNILCDTITNITTIPKHEYP